MFGNPLLDCEPETVLDETSVKVEVYQGETPAPDYETVFVPSTSYWDGSNKQMDVLTDEVIALTTEANGTSDPELTTKQKRTVPKRTREPKVQISKPTTRQRKDTVKAKTKLKETKAVDRRKKEFRQNARSVSEIV